jgi:predicted alpha/beta-fold hydrolase
MHKAPWWLPGGHAQTIWASKIARDGLTSAPAWRRERIDAPDGDFIDIDHVDCTDPGAPLLVLFHGLEGSRDSHYSRAMAAWALRHRWHLALPHFRGCSGELNRAPRAYHSGDHAEIDFMLRHLVAQHRLHGGTVAHAMGVSLGGNALMAWAAEMGQIAQHWVSTVTSISSPLDLTASGHAIGRGLNRWIYTPYFLRSMLPKALAKWHQYPGLFDVAALSQVRDLYQFDQIFTAPLHGFQSADDYWLRASAKPKLRDIRIPAYLINAQNDPFIPAHSLPTAADISASCQLIQSPHGGHVGYLAGHLPPGQLALHHLLKHLT